jgi:hypothetical protein
MPDNADDWLWDPDSPFRKLGGWELFGAEQKKIIVTTLERYPLMHLITAAQECLDQFLSFRTEVSLSDNAPTLETIADRAPALHPALMAARQQLGTVNVGLLNAVHVPVEAAAIVALALILLLQRWLKVTLGGAALCATVLLALIANAVICGTFSHSVDRYQSRLAWLAPFAAGLALAGRRTRR